VNNPKLIEHIRTRLNEGASPEILKTTFLATGGWSEEELDEVFDSLENSPSSPPNPPPFQPDSELQAPISVADVPPSPGSNLVKVEFLKKRVLLPLTLGVLLLVIIAGGWLLIKDRGLFLAKTYNEDNFLSNLLLKTSSINSVVYGFSISLDVGPRDSNAKPFSMSLSNEEQLSSGLPSPSDSFLVSMEQSVAYLPSEMSLSLSSESTMDLNIADWKASVDARGDFGDLSFKMNMEAVKKDLDYYLKINNLPSLFFSSMDSLKGQWIKISSDSADTDKLGLFSYALELFKEAENKQQETRGTDENSATKNSQRWRTMKN
jgi:hypothetical protein